MNSREPGGEKIYALMILDSPGTIHNTVVLTVATNVDEGKK